MADPAMALLDYLRKFGADLDGDFLREGVQLLTQMRIAARRQLLPEPLGASQAVGESAAGQPITCFWASPLRGPIRSNPLLLCLFGPQDAGNAAYGSS